MSTPLKTFTTEDLLNKTFSAEEFPRLERIALENFAVPFAELSPRLQFAVRQKAEQEAAKDMLAALRAIIVSRGKSDYDEVDLVDASALRLATVAINQAEGRL